MTLALQLAERIHCVADTGLPDEVVYWANVAILDTVGVMLAGSAGASARITAGLVAPACERGVSVLFGLGRRVQSLDAALINGAAAHSLDFDCVADTMAGHPTVQVVPALLALSEMLDCDGRAFVAACVAGLETQARIARGIVPSLGRGGWFTTSTLGTFGATAACAHLLRLDTTRIAQALGLAAMLASGILANAGTMAKALAAGNSARNGLLAALLARDGFTAAADALEHRQGFLAAFNGGRFSDPTAMLANWGDKFDLVDPGIWIKQYPCCGIAHTPIDLLARLREQHAFATEDVVGMEVLLHPQRVAHVDRPAPRTNTDAAFSIQYCLARSLVDGHPTLAHFEEDAFRDPGIRRVMQRIQVGADPDTDAASTHYGEQFGAELMVVMADDREFVARAARPLGHGPAIPLSDSAIDTKFTTCAGRALPSGQVARLLETLRKIETLASMRALTALAMPGGD